MYKGLEFAAVGGVILALATGGSASALVPRTAKASKNCSNQTVSVGKGRPKQTLRLVVTGNASCAEAHRVVGSYFRKMAAGRCGLQNNRCALTVATGYGCSIISPVAEHKELGGAFYGCVRSNAKILLYKTRNTSPLLLCHRTHRSSGCDSREAPLGALWTRSARRCASACHLRLKGAHLTCR